MCPFLFIATFLIFSAMNCLYFLHAHLKKGALTKVFFMSLMLPQCLQEGAIDTESVKSTQPCSQRLHLS